MASLFIEAIWNRLRRLGIYFTEIWQYYGNTEFRRIDGTLIYLYLLHNPYTVAKDFALQQAEQEIYTYGETPLTTMEQIANEAAIRADDVVFELGSGRGRTCFWLHSFIGCEVVGIECNPEFIRRAAAVAQKWEVRGVCFLCEDFLQSDLEKASVLYLDGTCLDPASIKCLAEKISSLPVGTRVITVSFPMPGCTLTQKLTLPFTWGEAEVFFQHVSRL